MDFVGAIVIGGILYLLSEDKDLPKNEKPPEGEKPKTPLSEVVPDSRQLVLTQEEVSRLRRELKSAVKRKRDLLQKQKPQS